MSSYLDNLHAGSLQLAHYALHGAQSEDEPLKLLKHAEASGSLDELLSLPVGQFTFEAVQADFDGFGDSGTSEQRTLTVLGTALTDSMLAQLQGVEWQGRQYKLAVRNAPESLNRNWHFLATPMS
jgi:hypothetical protein